MTSTKAEDGYMMLPSPPVGFGVKVVLAYMPPMAELHNKNLK